MEVSSRPVKFRFKDSILFKESGKGCVMVLDFATNDLYEFRGEVSKLILMLSKASFSERKGLTMAEMMAGFAKSKLTQKALRLGIADALEFLSEKKLLRVR